MHDKKNSKHVLRYPSHPSIFARKYRICTWPFRNLRWSQEALEIYPGFSRDNTDDAWEHAVLSMRPELRAGSWNKFHKLSFNRCLYKHRSTLNRRGTSSDSQTLTEPDRIARLAAPTLGGLLTACERRGVQHLKSKEVQSPKKRRHRRYAGLCPWHRMFFRRSLYVAYIITRLTEDIEVGYFSCVPIQCNARYGPAPWHSGYLGAVTLYLH